MVKKQWLKWLWIFAVVLVMLGLWWAYPSWRAQWDWVLEHSEKLRNLFLIAAGLIGVFFLTWRTSIASIDAETKKQNGINNMYTNAIEQLGKEHEKGRPNLEVRIGALYSLEKLAQSNTDYRKLIMDVLFTYVHNNAPLPKDPKSPQATEYSSLYENKPRADIQTALTIIGRRNTGGRAQKQLVDLSNCYLVGANLYKASLYRASLYRADLRGAKLLVGDLRDVLFQSADLREADLRGADLKGADLEGADLRACYDLTCFQLESAKNWKTAYRDPELACGADIPDPSEKDKKEAEQKDKDV